MIKFLFLLVFLPIVSFGKETCNPFEYQIESNTVKLKKNLKSEDILEIIVVDKNGKTHYLSRNEFAVVPINQLVTSKEVTKVKTISCKKIVKDPPKNLLGVKMVYNQSFKEPYGVGFRYDRNTYKNMYLGAQADTFGTYSLGISISF